jgi:hypothetical protein
MVKRYKISYAVGSGLNAREVAFKTWAFYDGTDGYLHAIGSIINREGTIVNVVFSTLSIRRLVTKDCLDLIDSFRK